MTTLLYSDRDDFLRPPSLQSRFIEHHQDLFDEPMSEYFEEGDFTTARPSKYNFRPPLVSPVYTPTLSSISSDATSDGEGDEIALPAFETDYLTARDDAQTDSVAGLNSDSDGLSTPKVSPSTNLGPGSDPTVTPLYRTSSDDASIESEPERHVDYLSHDWREEDIWTSWRYVVSRKDRYSNGVRLENASWRTWAKAKYGLRTVSPETLNWLKDCDVTWLYGPLQTDFKSIPHKPPPPSGLSSSNSFLDRKSILKKKTASEAILQRSLSQHTLLKHAGAILQAQKAEYSRGKPSFERATSDVGIPLARILEDPFNSAISTHCTPSESQSSGLVSPSERRHIHFNNEVVQCIAVEAKDYEEHDVDPSLFFLGEEYDNDYDEYGVDDNGEDNGDTESDEGIVMMKQVHSRSFSGTTSLTSSSRSTPRSSTSSESKTIAPLPPTTLKCRSETPEPPSLWTGQNQNGFGLRNGSKLSPSPSVETLRPPRPEANFLLDDDDDEDDDEQPKHNENIQWSFNNKNNQQHQRGRHSYDSSSHGQDRPWFVNPADQKELENDGSGGNLHLTPSGMFMPYDESEASYTGVFGRVVDTVNTARDIAHVIWNVGWRK